ncbi:MAG: SGNH/GDSL hydrolase family protein [Clostridia bacterium]|nr:SGNH/GDSL hydrolase family protein [Clostridia bacterium]
MKPLHSLKTNTDVFAGIRMNVIGDSITHGTYTAPGDIGPASVTDKPWCILLGEQLGFSNVNNYGISGISISSTTDVNPLHAISSEYATMSDEANLILVAGGTNDYGTCVKLGTTEDAEDVSFYGGLHVLCKGLRKKYPHAVIVFITPINRTDEAENENGNTLDQYRRAIYDVASGVYGFSVIDGSTLGFTDDMDTYLSDGVHPTPDGHRLFADAVAKLLVPILSKASR